MNKKLNLKLGIITLLIGLAAVSRLLPHPPNFTPIGGMALFGAAWFSRKYLAFIIPFVAILFSDLILNKWVYTSIMPNLDTGITWMGSVWVYFSFFCIVLLGFFALKKIKITNVVLASLGASAVFYLITNFGVWMQGVMYPKTVEGLLACYTAAIPFFWNTLAGDLFYVGVLFGSFALVQRFVLSRAVAS